MIRRVVILGLVLAGCGGGVDHLPPAPYTGSGADAGGTGGSNAGVLPTETASQAPWVAPSDTLACGQPCAGLTEAGRCEGEVALRCEAGLVVCDECPSTGRTCVADDGPARCERPCEGDEICPPGEDCFVRTCCPNTRWCERGAQAICDQYGSEVLVQPCQRGLDCIDGQCVPAQPFVHVLFDTSGSMTWSPSGAEVGADAVQWPACDDPDAPQTRLGISKVAFRRIFTDPQYDAVLFSLQRFPQRLDPYVAPACHTGGYTQSEQMTGHTGYGAGLSGGWFIQNLSEILVVPFPRHQKDSNREVLASWLDFEYEVETGSDPCYAHADCPGGLCTRPVPSGGVCRFTRDPELRADPFGGTPLGTSLFYAGEYLREQVVVEGRECILDADCGAPHHFCSDGRCADPNRFCRQRSIVAFTDGVDTTSPSAWLNPVVQARRLRGGLDCTSDGDCGPAFRCDQGTCQPSGALCGDFPVSCEADRTRFPDAPAAVHRLTDRNGDPIDVTVHIIDGSGALAAGAPIAGYGGGLLVQAELASPEGLLERIRPVIDWKDVGFCPDLE